MANLKTRYTDAGRRGFFKVGVVLARAGITADMLTYFGLLLQVGVVPLILTGNFVWAVPLGVVAAICDALDGAVARAGAGPTTAGAFLDSSTDRISELMVGGALTVYFAGHDMWWTAGGCLIFLGASQMVSYTRARAEALGVECKVGLMSRPERLVVLAVGFLLSGWHLGGTSVLVWIIWILVVLTSLTVVQRMLYVMRKLRRVDAGRH